MSDVSSAFKILIQAQPDQALSAFRDIVASTQAAEKSASDWKETVTALNSAWELTGKVFDVVVDSIKMIGETMIDATKASVEFIAAGGEYNEQRTQFESLAQSYNTSGDAIINVLDDISGGTTTVEENMRIATKGLSAGLSLQNDSFQVAMTFAKKYSESTGEDFNSVAEKITKAMATGKLSTLSAMGIIVKEGTTTGDALKQMATQLQTKFTDTGINVGDSVKAMGNAWEWFKEKVGAAINVSAVGSAIARISDEMRAYLKTFDTAKVTDFFNTISKSLENYLEKNGITFESVQKAAESAFETIISASEMAIKSLVSLVLHFGEIKDAVSSITEILVRAGEAMAVAFVVANIVTVGSSFAAVSAAVGSTAEALGALVVANPIGALVVGVGVLAAAWQVALKAYLAYYDATSVELGVAAKGRTLEEADAWRKKFNEEKNKESVIADPTIEAMRARLEGSSSSSDTNDYAFANMTTAKAQQKVDKQAAKDADKAAKKAASEDKKETAKEKREADKEQRAADKAMKESAKESLEAAKKIEKERKYQDNLAIEQFKKQVDSADKIADAAEAKAKKKGASAAEKSTAQTARAYAEKLKSDYEAKKEAFRYAVMRGEYSVDEAKTLEQMGVGGSSGSSNNATMRGTAFQRSLSKGSQKEMVDVTKQQSENIQDLTWSLDKISDALRAPVRVEPANTSGAIEQLINAILIQATVLAREEGTKVLGA